MNDVLRHRELMISGSIDRAILHLGAPAALAALLQAGFLVVDTFWLGRVGAVAIAAASTAGFVMWLAQTLGEGAANGSGAVLANAVGADDEPGARRSAAAGQALAVWGSAVVSSLGLASANAVFVFMGTAGDVSAAGIRYLWVILLGMPAYFIFSWLSAAFRATGDARTPLKLLAIAAVVNLVVDPVLIFGLGPIPALGVTGAALATVAAWLISAAWGWVLLGRMGLRPAGERPLRPPRREVWMALKVGVPARFRGCVLLGDLHLPHQGHHGFWNACGRRPRSRPQAGAAQLLRLRGHGRRGNHAGRTEPRRRQPDEGRPSDLEDTLSDVSSGWCGDPRAGDVSPVKRSPSSTPIPRSSAPERPMFSSPA